MESKTQVAIDLNFKRDRLLRFALLALVVGFLVWNFVANAAPASAATLIADSVSTEIIDPVQPDSTPFEGLVQIFWTVIAALCWAVGAVTFTLAIFGTIPWAIQILRKSTRGGDSAAPQGVIKLLILTAIFWFGGTSIYLTASGFFARLLGF